MLRQHNLSLSHMHLVRLAHFNGAHMSQAPAPDMAIEVLWRKAPLFSNSVPTCLHFGLHLNHRLNRCCFMQASAVLMSVIIRKVVLDATHVWEYLARGQAVR